MIHAIVVLIGILIPAYAWSQSFQNYMLSPVNGGFNGESPTGAPLLTDQVLLNRLNPGNTYSTSSLQLGDFASANDVRALYMSNQYIQSERSRISEGTALASAITILPPNPGDRFNITFSGAGYNSKGAGAVSGSYKLTEQALIFAGYARSQTENLVKGGVSFSFK